ncbi:MAG: nitroreductase family protein [Alphaproteobacteria bacterium]|nr:nitroreductase family protein [Alphaproteobacteria bacterium]MBU0864498.1 nitroreductase family protein [Alphaproteobacteria bacterium]MBU1826404.1 nitroreductase family protein [Alphaproteobacteria bacterium]
MKPHATIPYTALPAITDAERIAAAETFRDHVATRRTCRMFADTPVPRAVIEAAIAAAGTAPSGANHQPWHFAAIASPDIKHRIRVAAEKEEREFYASRAGQEWLEALAPLGTDEDKRFLDVAPWLIVVFGQRRGGIEPGDTRQNYYVTESVGIASGLLLTALHSAGLATLTHTPSPMGFLREICGRPTDEKPLMLIVTGHPAPDATVPVYATRKKPLDQITSWL